ncbi:hypothetical protein VaNZ11_003213 [Volvox africanus]|uniref:Calcineurin-like phosphoesterase domain-containing protein n=1 Tax=Volvox africanus TaxID=51714 RepID=A0ABQ5RTM1_9CHLO|nr:hypothetical protein VaNZ11_003213 [Volvox africanus]
MDCRRMHQRSLEHGVSCRSNWSTARKCIILVLIFGITVVVFHSGRANIAGRVNLNSSNDIILYGLPLPEFDPGLDLSERFSLIFPSTKLTSDNGDSNIRTNRSSTISAVNAASDGGSTHSRLVVIPDLHGDAPQAFRALRLAGLVSAIAAPAAAEAAAAAAATDPNGGGSPAAATGTANDTQIRESDWRWSGGDVVLVQLGDVVDRGPDSLALLIRLKGLQMQARAAGGDIVMLLGNHELMNIYHDFRYVSHSEAIDLAVSERLKLSPSMAANSTTSATGNGRRMAEDTLNAGGSAVATEQHPEAVKGAYGNFHVVHAVKDFDSHVERELRQETGLEAAAEDVSLAAETHAVRRGNAGDRELLYASTMSITSTDGGHLDLRGRRALLQQQRLSPQQRQRQEHQLFLSGLKIWRDTLAANTPMGSFIRQRPLAAIVNAGGCNILAVHAGAFPWMLRAVEILLQGRRDPGEGAGEGGTGGTGGTGGGVSELSRGDPLILQPEQYIAGWNAAVAQALQNCEGRRCSRHDSISGDGSGTDAGHNRRQEDDNYERFRLALADLLLDGEGAVWSRRYDKGPRQKVCGEVLEMTRRLGVQKLVVGHTVQWGGRVSSRCGGQLVMADVGISRAIAGEMAVLQCVAGKLDVVYGNGRMERIP